MGQYKQKFDKNGLAIPNEAIKQLKRVDVTVTSVLNAFNVTIPSDAYGVIFKKIPSTVTAVDVQFNGNADKIPVSQGDIFSPFVDLNALKITTTGTATTPIVLVFVS